LRTVALALGLILAVFVPSAAVAQSTSLATVVHVVDGDTVDVQFDDGHTERIRAIGMDTPEVVDPRRPVQCFGREASQHAHELLDGQVVGVELDPSQVNVMRSDGCWPTCGCLTGATLVRS
jgi:endonuclease YncB( thermonuclease family)